MTCCVKQTETPSIPRSRQLIAAKSGLISALQEDFPNASFRVSWRDLRCTGEGERRQILGANTKQTAHAWHSDRAASDAFGTALHCARSALGSGAPADLIRWPVTRRRNRRPAKYRC